MSRYLNDPAREPGAPRRSPPWDGPDAGCRWTPAAPGADGPAAEDEPTGDGSGPKGQGWLGGRLDDYEEAAGDGE